MKKFLLILSLVLFLLPLKAHAYENLFRDPLFQSSSGLTVGTELNWLGSGTLNSLNITGYSVAIDPNQAGTELITYTVTGATYLQVHDLIGSLSAGCDTKFTANGALIHVLSTNLTNGAGTFTATAPYNYAPAASGSCTALQKTPGDFSGVTSDLADGWSKSMTAIGWLDAWNSTSNGGGATNTTAASRRSLAVKKSTSTGTHQVIWQTISKALVPILRGQTITETIKTKQGTKSGAGTAKAYFDVTTPAGTTRYFGSALAGAGDFENASLSYAMPSDLTALDAGVEMEGAADDVYYFAEPMLAMESSLPTGYFIVNARSEYDMVVKSTCASYNLVAVTFPSTHDTDVIDTYGVHIDFFGDCGGSVYWDVAAIQGTIECLTSNKAFALSYRNSEKPPVIYKIPPAYMNAASTSAATGDDFISNVDRPNGLPGTGWLYATSPGASCSQLNWDLEGVRSRN